ncbi:3-dehydroquinate synthase [Daejeonella sp. H1SJ63]|jgi:3-dehydroquinate synthase|uniref:3-dehydroquinate synthase n=1 Tax=Daejeonella sp. H1SJ63 TaxID=3034145 RepID=UPI0023EBD4FB|nr:3-dehydroquinate synthase [Daejeonella sp. H1SJ63]
MKPIKSISYSVFFGDSLQELRNFLNEKNYSKVFVLVDSNTEIHCLPILQNALGDIEFDLIEVSPGEENKNIDFCIGIWRMLLDFGADRNSIMINLGGGVITDMGGFAASTFKRGIDFVQVPTTLLSQVDASVGGKTGIDMENVKNIIGTFTQPKAVFIYSGFLKTLSERELRSGYAEVIKHGMIYDRNLFNMLRDITPADLNDQIIHRSVEIKNEVVIEDPLEKGLRKILNFGHTIGHAVESWSLRHDKMPLLHGEAIAIGFICEAWLSVRKNGLKPSELDEIVKALKNIYPFYKLNKASYTDLLEIMKNDKKNNAGKISFSLLSEIGKCGYDIFCTGDEIFESLDYYLTV